MAERRPRIQGKSYGQKRPPLTHILQSILERYPDGGQILKEIIQNADDAGATKVTFLLDSRPDFYGKDSLYASSLAQFQGPALYAHNNALFDENDWDNLEKLMRSSKKDDPLKVGRFGIGFNSVYHMTDLPSIVSGNAIVFLDPHETHFGKNETGQRFSLEDLLLQEYPDQFTPYENVLDCKISTRFYKGTLFRFPLRRAPSDLSKKKYTNEKVRNLFQALKEEASIILLFLKNIEEIALFETDERNIEKHVFTVRLSDSCKREVGQKKRTFLTQVEKLSKGQLQNTHLCLHVNVTELNHKSSAVENKWLVYHEVDARNQSLKAMSLELGLLPWVGFATPLNESQREVLLSTGGRIFCFLPLPPDADSKTGLSVHVHGYFGLTDNRRGLKWPGLDCQNDQTAEWNVSLVKRVASQAYANLLLNMVDKRTTETSGFSLTAEFVYQSWPNLQEVEKHWKVMLKPMYSVLMRENVFWTPVNGGQWISLHKARFDRIKSEFPSVTSEVREVVFATLTEANEAVVAVPSHVMKAIDKYTPEPTKSITPAYLRGLLKKRKRGSWNVKNIPKKKKFKLLEFTLKDERLEDMQGVPLLPLADGSFVDFCPLEYNQDPDRAVYVPSTTHPRSIFHSMDSKFLEDKGQSPALNYLSKVASDVQKHRIKYPLQLVKLNTRIAINLLRQMFPPEWSREGSLAPWNPGINGHPPDDWLKCVWKWIQDAFPSDLSPLRDLPLIPHTFHGSRSLMKLSTSSLAIRQHYQGLSLQPVIVSLLQKIGCIVLTNLPSYVYHYGLYEYIALPNPLGVLNVLCALGKESCVRMIPCCSAEEKIALRRLISSMPLDCDQRRLILYLPIFDAVDGKSFVALRDGFESRTVFPANFHLPQSLPVPDASIIISSNDSESYTLLQRLGIPLPTPATFLMDTIFRGIESSFYSHQDISSLMCWVLRSYYVLCSQDSSFHRSLRELHFVLTQSNSVVTARDVLDPQEPMFQKLYEGENDKFPRHDFLKNEILQPLRELGMRSAPNAGDILHVAKTLHSFHVEVASRKASALLEFLNTNPYLLGTEIDCDNTLAQALMNERWIKRMEKRPPSYPHVMPWFSGTGNFFKPSEVLSQSKANLAGASVAIISEVCSFTLETVFGWNESPTIQNVLAQLLAACSVPLHAMNDIERYRFQVMMKEIYEEASTNTSFTWLIESNVNFPPWVWHGNGFTSPYKIAFDSPCKIDLTPYLYTVPQDFWPLRSFFQRCGVRKAFNDSNVLEVLTMIKEKHDTSSGFVDVADDHKLSREILHWIVRDGKPLNSELRKNLLVPAQTWDDTLRLVPCSECTFCDAAWLRKGGSELQISSTFPMIHEAISSKIAALLGVPPISKRLTCAEALGIEQTGPHEPPIIRLKNILNEYKEGVGVFRELVQNADDAGATEVHFLLDWRSHPTKKLLSSGMADCQGPALLVYNNATFTDTDLQNISKLGGATKKGDLEKIGRFGLGFSSVYHFTDVPSFISRSYAVFFDPTTRHLGPLIDDALKPGIKIDLEVNPANLIYTDQFIPYNGLFDCDTISSNDLDKFFFQGTLFRFPFRTKRGEISDKVYNDEEIQSLVHSFQELSSTLLLFAQNVEKVTFLEVDKDVLEPSNPRILFEMCKETADVLQPHNRSIEGRTFIEACAAWTRQRSTQSTPFYMELPPKRTEVISVCSTINSKTAGKRQKTCFWLITSCLGIEDSLQLATSEEGEKQGLLPASGIAAKFSSDNDKDGCINPKEVHGEVFCFLPLSIPTGLPVHVNGYFAVTSNRRGIWESTTADFGRQPLEVRWNRSLMEDAVSQAYIELLADMMLMQQQGIIPSYKSFSLWPNPKTLQSSAWEPLINSVYQRIAKSDLPLVDTGGKWRPVTQCIYQDAKLLELPKSETVLAMLDCKAVHLPDFARKGFQMAGCIEVIDQRTMTQEKFLEDVFFPNIMRIPDDLRDPIVCQLIDECLRGTSSYQSNQLLTLYKSLLSTKRCIPCGPNMWDLATPKELISPRGTAATLFSADEKKFPVGCRYHTKERLLMLENLGMPSDILDWETLLERANSVTVLCSKAEKDARKRVSCLVNYINDHLHKVGFPSESIKSELMSVSMFPVLSKPTNYTMPWRGSEHNAAGTLLVAADEMYGAEYKFVAGSSRPILDESEAPGCGKLSKQTRDLFGFSCRKPSAHEVIRQLDHAGQVVVHSSDEISSLEDVFNSIYSYLQKLVLKSEDEVIVNALKDRCWIFTQGKCLSPAQLAFKWERFAEPYLYKVPTTLALKYHHLFKATGVKDCFSTEDVIRTLYKLGEEKRGKRLSDSEFKVSKSLIEELLEAPREVIRRENGKIPLPDHNLVLQPAEKLAINDAPWVTATSRIDYVHKHVPIDLAYELGAIDIRTKKLADISRPIGRSFGQREELTDRLKGILKSYPCDVGILKELVQNADDAGATELHFIYDPRNHPTKHLLSESWKELQGPALCVYNNRPFLEKDLEGIQRLGIGSKVDDPTKTGQYGIGFNAVYHLTDCPSFISNGDTLCILDPHCRYAPGATKENPGRLIGPIGEEERSDYRDIFPCYLENLFDLTSATLFRFPLRNEMSTQSLISHEQVSHETMMYFMNMFAIEAKEILLFLNHVKKITLSEIKGGQLTEIYSVSARLTDEDNAHRAKLSNHMKNSMALQTKEIDWLGITYTLSISDPVREEKWLIHQCVGLQASEEHEVPEGRDYGLLPRGGIAAKISEQSKFTSLHYSHKNKSKYKAFCFLPLPLDTGLPVHVNGHFFLDSARRNLWRDENEEGFGSKWNHFMKAKVLAQAYVSLMLVARAFLPGLKNTEVPCFAQEYSLHEGMRWYHNLFPRFNSVESQWAVLVKAVFQKICNEDEKLLPLTKKTFEVRPQASDQTGQKEVTRCFWLPPSQGFFNTMSPGRESDTKLETVLLKVGFKLLYSSHGLFNDFKKAATNVREITPEAVINFLKEHPGNIGRLPCPVCDTTLGSVVGVLFLVSYCMESPKFPADLFGMPLLLTDDGILKCFQEGEPVFLSLFVDLVPNYCFRFVNRTLAKHLLDIQEEIFTANQDILKKFDINALASLLPSTANASWCETDTPVSWDLNEGPSKRWLQRLWEFLFNIYKQDNKNFSLEPITHWPILPTQSGQLAPVSKGKVMLDLTPSESWSPGQKHVVVLLRKLGCPEVNIKLISSDGRWEVSNILKPHLSYPNSSEDILQVLYYLTKEVDIAGCLTEDEMLSVLQFLQDDVTSLKRDQTCASIVKKLPFFKTFHGTFVRLDNVSSIYVIPKGLPTEESEVWMTRNDCVFLATEPKLDRLYNELLGVGNKTHTDCYVDFIFPTFSSLQQKTRMLHLDFVRRLLLELYCNEDQRSRVLNSLNILEFIPDANGTLQPASFFYDPRVTVFSVMLPREAMPPQPFNEESGWLDLLREIGLKQEVSKDQFLEFSKEVEMNAKRTSEHDYSVLEEKSRTLVTHLLNDESLHDVAYLKKLSTLKFVAPTKASDGLLSLHSQYLYSNDGQDGGIPFTQFRGSLPDAFERLAWTSASLLPRWAVPRNKKLKALGVLKEPSLDQVVDHITNLSQSVSKHSDREQPSPKRLRLSEIMTEVYTFLKRASNCSESSSFDSCSQACREIGRQFANISCILVDDGHMFVRGNQLAFRLDEEIPPYLYMVPRQYGAFEHLFKRLGAMEEATPLQFAQLLSCLKESCRDDKMHVNECTVAKHAVHGLFFTLNTMQDRSGKVPQDNPLTSFEVLYLPSSEQKLQRSTDLVLFDCPQYKRRVPNSMYEFLDKPSKYEITFVTSRQLVDLLPVHLKMQSLASLVREELQAECRDKKCRADMEQKCHHTNHLRDVLFSPHLVGGIIRILKFQFEKAKLTEDVCDKVRSFQNELKIICMDMLSTVLVENGSNTPIPGSQLANKDCFVEHVENYKKHIFINHGAEPGNVRRVLCKEINQLTGCYIDKDSWLHLTAILECNYPDEISSILDNAGVSQDVDAGDSLNLEPDLGSELPEELHFLLVQYDDFYFRPGEFVVFERPDSGDEEPKYFYAKIISKLEMPHSAEPINLLSRYLIDIGNEQKEVNVLDIYKIIRPNQLHTEEDNFSYSMEVVPCAGRSEQSSGEANRESTTPSRGVAESPKPRTLEDALKEVQEALAEIRQIPEDQQKKAIRRLFLRWHPDKNRDMQEIANEVTKFIQSEYEKLSTGGVSARSTGSPQNDCSDWFRRWHQRARRQRSSYENFRRNNSGFNGFASYFRRRYTAPNPQVSKIWLHQSKEDLRSVELLLTTLEPPYYLVCFQCHQVVEKALKAAFYALSGVADRQLRTHDLVKLAHELSLLPGAPNVTTLVARLSTYYENTRYPDKHVPPTAPADVYQDSQQAQEAFRVATAVLAAIEQYVEV